MTIPLYDGSPIVAPGFPADAPYTYHTKPFAHQHTAFLASASKPYFALFMEQGTGKTKVLLDTAAALYRAGKVSLVVVATDNNLHAAWVEDEVPKHWPPSIPYAAFIWRSARASTKRAQHELQQWMMHTDRCLLLTVNVEAALVPSCTTMLVRLLKTHRALFIIDESTSIKSPSAKRTKVFWALGKMAPYRRIATGIPAPESPLNLWAQGRFLASDFWKESTYVTFKHAYALWEPRRMKGRTFEVPRKGADGRPEYQNLDQLMAQLAPHSFRVMKDECLDLPPKLFQTVRFDLTPEQRAHYEAAQAGFMLTNTAELNGPEITMAMLRLLRGQQISSGYVVPPLATDHEADALRWGAPRALADNPRLDTLLNIVEHLREDVRVMIWARFTYDVDRICAALSERRPGSVVRYDGKTSAEDKSLARQSFQDPTSPVRYFVAKSRSGGKGLTLTQGSVCIFYSHEPSLEYRLQSEDRAHRIGQHKNVTIISLEARHTWDAALIAMRDWKFADMSQLLSALPPEAWSHMANGVLPSFPQVHA